MTERATLALDDEAGFTLVETIVAFAILALVVSAAVKIVGDGGVRQRSDAARMTALLYAQSKLAGIVGTGEVSPGMSAGSIGDGVTWRVEATPMATDVAASVAVVPYAVIVEVFTPEPASQSVELKTVVLGQRPE